MPWRVSVPRVSDSTVFPGEGKATAFPRDVQLRVRKVGDVEVSAHVPVPQADARVQSGERYPEDQVSFPFRQEQLVRHSFDVETGRAVHREAHGCSGRSVDSCLDQASDRQKKAEGEEGQTSRMQRRFHGQFGDRCLIASESSQSGTRLPISRCGRSHRSTQSCLAGDRPLPSPQPPPRLTGSRSGARAAERAGDDDRLIPDHGVRESKRRRSGHNRSGCRALASVSAEGSRSVPSARRRDTRGRRSARNPGA